MSIDIVIAGFGGQGILFTGKMIAYCGMLEEKYVSWLPSYGPEMRGGTASCSVCLDEQKPIGCPMISEPELLMAMNLPSFNKYINDVVPGGYVVYDSALIDAKVERKDIKGFPIPATNMAMENGLKGLANIILLGQAIKAAGFTTLDAMIEAITKSIPAKKAHLLEPNIKALKLGYEY